MRSATGWEINARGDPGRADVAGILPDEHAIARLSGAVLLKANDGYTAVLGAWKKHNKTEVPEHRIPPCIRRPQGLLLHFQHRFDYIYAGTPRSGRHMTLDTPPPLLPPGPQLLPGRIINPQGLPPPPMPPGGPPPPPGGRMAPARTQADRLLDKTIESVCTPGQPGVYPMKSYSKDGQSVLMSQPEPVSTIMAQRLLTCLAARGLGNDDWQRVANTCTVRQFRAMTTAGQIDFINRFWNALATTHAFNTRASAMVDPAYDVPLDDRAPLPSSWCPTQPGANTHKKRLAGRQPWKEFGIGFRIDGNNQDAIIRNTTKGFTQQRLTQPFMLGVRGQQIEGTVLMDQTRARVWTGNLDIFNETAVCVSRNFFGATAFPERNTVQTVQNSSLLWAVNCQGLLGFDTEGYQIGLGKSAQWRPGEKAFARIPVSRIVGYVRVQRLGDSDIGGWSFEIAKDAAWTFVGGAPSPEQRSYMIEELNAWKGKHEIPPLYDFATG